MATVTQIYGLVNDAAKEALGSQAITVKNTTSLVSLGDVVLSSETNIDLFYKKLADRIGRTVIAIRNYEPKARRVMKDDMAWGIALQKISFALKEASANPAWTEASQASPYDIEPQTDVIQKLFNTMSTYDFSDSIPSYQMFTAFTNEAAMGAFVAGIYTNQSNMLAVAEENLANVAVSTNMAVCLKSTNVAQKRNLLAEYNTAHGESQAPVAFATCLEDINFLKFATREIMNVTKNMTKMSVLFNDKSRPVFTDPSKQVVEVLGLFASAQSTYLQADTYHKDLVELPAYEEVVYWQAPGVDFSFANCSTINIDHDKLGDGLPVEQGGIIAFVHDEDSCGSIITRHRQGSLYNGYAERMNFWDHADKGFYVDSSENAVVFYIAV